MSLPRQVHDYAAEMVGKLAKNTPIHNNVQAPAPERPTAIINVCAPEVSAPEVSALEVSALEVGGLEVCAPEVCGLEVCVPEVCAPEVSALEVSVPEVCAPEVSVLEVCSAPSIFAIQPLFVIFQDFIELILRHGYSPLSVRSDPFRAALLLQT